MNREDIIEILSDNDDIKKATLLSHLKDLFESYNKNIENFSSIVQALVDYSAICADSAIQSDILEAIIVSETYQDVSQINFDVIAAALDKCSIDLLPRHIDILSYTNNPKYIKTILAYKEHENAEVRKSAEEALLELR